MPVFANGVQRHDAGLGFGGEPPDSDRRALGVQGLALAARKLEEFA
jgi:hypothetical protein